MDMDTAFYLFRLDQLAAAHGVVACSMFYSACDCPGSEQRELTWSAMPSDRMGMWEESVRVTMADGKK